MKRKISLMQHLWILFGLQLVVLVLFLVAYVCFGISMNRIITRTEQANARVPEIRKRLDQANFEQLHKDAFALLDFQNKQSDSVVEMERDVVRVIGSIIFVLAVVTGWLGIIVFRLNRRDDQKICSAQT